MKRLTARAARFDAPLFAVLILALALRLYNLTYHSMWLDETVSVDWARMPAGDIVHSASTMRTTAHPAFSYLALRAWLLVFGDSEAALRGQSAFFGMVLVALLYALGRDMASRRVGLLAALLAAINPYLIWYSQEVRMYALLATLSAASVWCLWRALQGGRLRWWLGYLATAIAAMYTVIIGALLAPVHLLLIVLARPAPWRRVLAGAVAVALAGLSFLPITLTAWRSSGTIATERAVPTLASLFTATPVFLLLRQAEQPWTLLAAPGVALALVGAAAALRRNWRCGLFLLLYLAVPLGLIFALSVWRLPIFGAPYVIMAAAPFLLLLALGIDTLWRRRRVAGVVSLVVIAVISVFAMRGNWQRSTGKEDWRAAAQYIATHAAPGDAILAVPDYASIPLKYYKPGNVPVLQPFGGPVSPEGIAQGLQGIEQFDTLWLVWSHGEQIDPAGQVRQWLIERYPILTEQWPHGVEVRAFAVRYRQPAAQPSTPLATFGARLALLSAKADTSITARDDIYHPPSGWVHVDLVWQRLGSADLSGLRVQARVIDGIGQVWGERLDRPTEAWRFYPPARWQPGETVRDAYDVNMNPATPRGRYRVEIQVLDSSGQALSVQAEGMPADRFIVTEVEVR